MPSSTTALQAKTQLSPYRSLRVARYLLDVAVRQEIRNRGANGRDIELVENILHVKSGIPTVVTIEQAYRGVNNLVAVVLGEFILAKAVYEIVLGALPVSLELGMYAMLLALLVGIPIGTIAALRQNTAWDYGPMSLAMLGVSVPNFVLGPLLIFVFALTLRWLPPALWGPPQTKILPAINSIAFG